MTSFESSIRVFKDALFTAIKQWESRERLCEDEKEAIKKNVAELLEVFNKGKMSEAEAKAVGNLLETLPEAFAVELKEDISSLEG